MIEFWRAGGSMPTTSAEVARAVEAEGWDGQMFMDSQSLTGDAFIYMGVWAMATERLKVCSGVSNPFTRLPAVIAAAAATVQSISGGRAYLGIGRGDLAMAYLGHAPVGLDTFERSLHELQTLLQGKEIAFGASGGDAASLDTLSLGDRPVSTRLQWLPPGQPKVPLDVAATGPKVIAMSARIAERVTFSVGAIPERIDWALGVAREARSTGSYPDTSYGAQIILCCHTDDDVAMHWTNSMVVPGARFQVLQGMLAGPVTASDLENFDAIRKGYDMTVHGKVGHQNRLVGTALSPDFVRRFAIVGPPDHCIERLVGLAKAGLERFVIVGPGFYPEPDPAAGNLFAREVMPAVRAAMS